MPLKPGKLRATVAVYVQYKGSRENMLEGREGGGIYWCETALGGGGEVACMYVTGLLKYGSSRGQLLQGGS